MDNPYAYETSDPLHQPAKPLMHMRDFRRLFLSATTSGLGAQISLLALPLVAIIGMHASAIEVGVLAALGTLPYVVAGLQAGAYLERARLKPVLSWSAFARTLILALIPILWALHRVNIAVLDILALSVGLMTMLYDIAWQAYLPLLVGRRRLHEASSRLTIATSGAVLLGPGLAGVLIHCLSAPLALLADALGFAVAGFAVRSIHAPEGAVIAHSHERMSERIAQGISYVAGNELLRWIAVGTAAWNFAGTALNVVLVLFEARVMHYSAGTIGLTFLLGNVGYLAAAPVVRGITALFGVGRTMLLGAVLGGVGPLLLPLARAGDAMAILVLGWFLRALGSPLYMVSQLSLRLAITPSELRARMTATTKFVVMGAMPLGSLLGGLFAGTFGTRTCLWAIAVVASGPICATGFSSLRRVTTLPEHHAPPPIVCG